MKKTTANTADKHFFVYRTGRTFGIYVQPGEDGRGQSLVEGGFFSRHAAQDAAIDWQAKASKGSQKEGE